MAAKWNILQLGTKIRLKGKINKDDKDGIITSYLTDENKVITGYSVKPVDEEIFVMAIALDDDFEVLKQIAIKCPWCKDIIQVEIENKYKDAEAIPQEGNLPKDEGHNQPCPKCERQLFIRYLH